MKKAKKAESEKPKVPSPHETNKSFKELKTDASSLEQQVNEIKTKTSSRCRRELMKSLDALNEGIDTQEAKHRETLNDVMQNFGVGGNARLLAYLQITNEELLRNLKVKIKEARTCCKDTLTSQPSE